MPVDQNPDLPDLSQMDPAYSITHPPPPCKTGGSIKRKVEMVAVAEEGGLCGVEEIVLIDIWVMERMRSLKERGISDKKEEEKRGVREEKRWQRRRREEEGLDG